MHSIVRINEQPHIHQLTWTNFCPNWRILDLIVYITNPNWDSGWFYPFSFLCRAVWRTPPSHLSLLIFSSSPLSPSVVVIPASLTCSFSLHTWTLFLACCLLLLFSKVPSLPQPLPPQHSIYHSLSPSHLSLLPSFHLSLHHFSSGSPLIKPLCWLPPCPVHPHVSLLSFPLLSVVLCFYESSNDSSDFASLCYFMSWRTFSK